MSPKKRRRNARRTTRDQKSACFKYSMCTSHAVRLVTRYTERFTSQFKNKCLAEMWSGSEEGSY